MKVQRPARHRRRLVGSWNLLQLVAVLLCVFVLWPQQEQQQQQQSNDHALLLFSVPRNIVNPGPQEQEGQEQRQQQEQTQAQQQMNRENKKPILDGSPGHMQQQPPQVQQQDENNPAWSSSYETTSTTSTLNQQTQNVDVDDKHNSNYNHHATNQNPNDPVDNPVGDKNVDDDHDNDDDKYIRSWGCGLRQTPFIFVHINKAGGGSIRRRIASSALNVTRNGTDWRFQSKDSSYYPIHQQRSSSSMDHNDDDKNDLLTAKASFCVGGSRQFFPRRQWSYERSRICTAGTPIGQAIACPAYDVPIHCGGRDVNNVTSAHVVYVGHNGLGTEMHWLPVPYLQNWWNQHWATTTTATMRTTTTTSTTTATMHNSSHPHNTNTNTTTTTTTTLDPVSPQWQRLDPTQKLWCGDTMKRPWNHITPERKVVIEQCGRQMRDEIDKAAIQALKLHHNHHHHHHHQHHHHNWNSKNGAGRIRRQQEQQQHTQQYEQQELGDTVDTDRLDWGRLWSNVYSSLPVLRVVMIREPFSWYVSKFAWHVLYRHGVVCDNITHTTAGAGHSSIYYGMQEDEPYGLQVSASTKPGWVRRLSLEYIYQLCGSDCRVRHLEERATLQEVVIQAEFNLRQAFAVVGILEDGQETFFDMIHHRVDYIDTTKHPDLFHGRAIRINATPSQGEPGRCKERYQNVEFQKQLIQASPEVASMVHLYQVAVQVNRFQQQELQQCKLSRGSQ